MVPGAVLMPWRYEAVTEGGCGCVTFGAFHGGTDKDENEEWAKDPKDPTHDKSQQWGWKFNSRNS